jgi:ATP-dependent DNA ligase
MTGTLAHRRCPPGSRRARLAGAVRRDDRHLDPGTGKFVTDFLKLKHDGYRLQIHVRDGRVRFYTITGADWSIRYPLIVEVAAI